MNNISRRRLSAYTPCALALSCTLLIYWLGLGTVRADQLAPTLGSVPAQAAVIPVTVRTDANLRAGPGADYARVGSVQAGQVIEIVARNLAGDWLQLANGAWIFSNLVENAPEVPVAATIPVQSTATPSPASRTPTVPTAEGTTQIAVKVVTNANLRAGPGVNYPKVGVVKAGQSLVIVAQNPEGNWYQTTSGAWIFGELLDGVTPLSVVSDIPIPLSTATSTRTVTTSAIMPETPITTGGDQEAPSPECNLESPLVCVNQAKIAIVNWLTADLIRYSTYLAGLSLWGAALMLLLARRRWRWVAHCILVTILLLPIGWFVTLLTGLFVLLNPHDPTSPRELVQAIVDSAVVKIVLLIVFLVLTAVSILGGFIAFAMLAIGYLVFLKLLPGPDSGSSPAYHVPSLPGPTTSSGGYLSDGTHHSDSDDSRFDRDPYPDDDDDDDDGGSIWDGWLVKW